MKTDITDIKKNCYLYNWLSVFLNKTKEEDRINLENKMCGRRKEDFEKIQFQLDIYDTFKNKFKLDEYEYNLYSEIKKQMSFKNRKNLDVSKLKTDVCEFLLRLDNPFYDGLEYCSMTSILYSEYSNVHKKIKKQLMFELSINDEKILNELILSMINKENDFCLSKKRP